MPMTVKLSRTRILGFLIAPLIVFGAMLTKGAAAQDAEQSAKLVEKLPQSSRDVIARLSALRELPDGQWKMHAGDLAHGEAANLDESGWQSIAPKSKAPSDAAWFRQTYEIPQTLQGYDLTGARIWFQFHAGANGPMPEILYSNGRRVAMGEGSQRRSLRNARKGSLISQGIARSWDEHEEWRTDA